MFAILKVSFTIYIEETEDKINNRKRKKKY